MIYTILRFFGGGVVLGLGCVGAVLCWIGLGAGLSWGCVMVGVGVGWSGVGVGCGLVGVGWGWVGVGWKLGWSGLEVGLGLDWARIVFVAVCALKQKCRK